MIDLTDERLLGWGGERKLQDARRLLERETVEEIIVEPPVVRGTLRSTVRCLRTGFRLLQGGCVESLCPCYESRERGVICAHVIALALAVRHRQLEQGAIAAAGEEAERAARLAALPPTAFLRRAAPGEPGRPAEILLVLPSSWPEQWAAGRLTVRVFARIDGRSVPLEEVPRELPLRLGPRDERLLFVAEDIGAGARSELRTSRGDFLSLLEAAAGGSLALDDGHRLTVHPSPLLQSRLHLDLDGATGELLLSVETPLPGGGVAAIHLLGRRRGWAGCATELWPLVSTLPEAAHAAYGGVIRIPRIAVPQFLRSEWPRLAAQAPHESTVTPEILDLRPAQPSFHVLARGSLASLNVTLYAVYDGTRLVAGKSDPAGQFAIPDPEDPLRYFIRNADAEAEALRMLARRGLVGECGDRLSPLVGERSVVNFLAREVPALRRRGWTFSVEGRAATAMEEAIWAVPVVRIVPAADGRSFEVEVRLEDSGGGHIPASEARRALLKGESFLEREGRRIWLDGSAVEALDEIFADCESSDGSKPGTFRLAAVHAAYVQDSLAALDGVDVEAPPGWAETAMRRLAAARRNGVELESVEIPDPPASHLRPYQRQGVAWLRHLERCGFAGILADDMGLGKTLQALAWLAMPRCDPDARGKPSLVVCPTSLMENWAQEAARFVPSLRVRLVAGSGRHDDWERLNDNDLLITSYALLRRDAERWKGIRLAAIILDEAQHIKNRATRNAIAAKGLQGAQRLVLTGTPMENSVTDLWSIMDFLMPGYLGSAESFRRRYEVPIQQGGEAAEEALARLRRKLRPFLLRRLKREVAHELPPRLERVATCSLTAEQTRVYTEILERSRRRIRELIAERGVEAARMEILRTLLRLRQVCCHLDLLRLPQANFEAPSAKLELLFELLEEAADGGHRVLVFSQFVSMLAIIRRELDRRGWRYCYLDGATTNRLEVVREFNRDRSIPVFLISLKAGGTGLNLIGADTVILYDPWWNPAVEDQAIDRAHRIGQTRCVYSVRLIARDTIEDRVQQMQRRKRELIQATVQAGGGAERLSWEDLRELLAL
ncbi:MAG: DEAD/DEAH box helicase [Kiritimatiellae bacterium]|nr:DEAD/DEAH box helicase [Kiritimatiellia bacterium]